MTNKFSEEKTKAALDAAKTGVQPPRASDTIRDSRALCLLAECISVKVEDNKVCLELPLNLGKECIPIPVEIPNGTVASACLHVCTTWGIPTGVRVIVAVAGAVVAEMTWGKCG